MKLRKSIYCLFTLLLLASCISKNQDAKLPVEGTPSFLWIDSTELYLPKTEEWTNRVEVADINNDGLIDVLFANGGNYSEPGIAEPARVFLNQGRGKNMKEVSNEIFGSDRYYSRVIKVYDINNDGLADIILGATFHNQTQLFFGVGQGKFRNATRDNLPAKLASVGDLELGDVDGDGDLDMALVDWGEGSNMKNQGGQTLLWINDGKGKFTDQTSERMPEVLIGFSWDLEFIDVDNDYDLDLVVSCKRCPGSYLFINEKDGYYKEVRGIPSYTNNYELEPMDIDGDGYIDLLTVNDGEIVDEISYNRREHVFINNKKSGFVDATPRLWPDSANIGEDDNNIVFLDYDSDGDPDFLLSSLTGEDRLLVNNGEGKFSLIQPVLENNNTPHTLSMVTADINGDCKLDVIMGQGEGSENLDERIFIGTNIPEDVMAPHISNVALVIDSLHQQWSVYARIHDYSSPLKSHGFSAVEILDIDDRVVGKMQWYGEYLWRYQSSSSFPESELFIQAVDKCKNIATQKINQNP